MSHAASIDAILIERDVSAFVARDWTRVQDDFDADVFTGYSGEAGALRLRYPTLDSYRRGWVDQADELADLDRERLARELRAAQRIDRLEIVDGRALAVKVFDGVIHSSTGSRVLEWTTYYFLRHDEAKGRWLITGFLGYLPTGWTVA